MEMASQGGQKEGITFLSKPGKLACCCWQGKAGWENGDFCRRRTVSETGCLKEGLPAFSQHKGKGQSLKSISMTFSLVPFVRDSGYANISRVGYAHGWA